MDVEVGIGEGEQEFPEICPFSSALLLNTLHPAPHRNAKEKAALAAAATEVCTSLYAAGFCKDTVETAPRRPVIGNGLSSEQGNH